ncbi:MAG: flagellin, partial [Lachnospiraceae bacterium]|nr:flagellin [Lachnospiraceae bacterium]
MAVEMSVQHNMTAMGANRTLKIATGKTAKSTQKLASGYKINSAADDAAGLSISEKMRRELRGLNQGKDNIQDGISCTQIMDGALSEVSDIMHRMEELCVHAANGTLTDDDRDDVEKEIKQLKKEIDRTTESTNFNTLPLLRGEPVEVIFIVDNTGSMGGMISSVKSNLASFTDGLAKSAVTYGMVEYGDLGEVGNRVWPFTSSPDEMR